MGAGGRCDRLAPRNGFQSHGYQPDYPPLRAGGGELNGAGRNAEPTERLGELRPTEREFLGSTTRARDPNALKVCCGP